MLPIEKQERTQILFALLVIVLYLSPLFILGENAHIRVHDNLDSNIAWYKVLSESGELFGAIDAEIPQIMNGLPRNAFGSEFSIIVWLYALFPTMVAYAISQALTRFIAFFGMYILLKKHLVTGSQSGWIRVGTSLAFALTPFWPSGMLSTLGMPLALWAFLNIRSKDHSWKNYLVLTLLPLYSSIVLGFFFFLVAMGFLWLTDVIRRKGWNITFLLSIVYMTFIFGLVEYRLVSSFIFDSEPNSRDEYFHARLPLDWVIKLTFKNFVLGHTHVMTVHALIILPITIFALYIILTKKLWRQEKVYVFLFGLNFILSAWYAFWFYKGWVPLTERFHTLDTFNFARFHFLRPMVIYLGFALAIKIIWEHSDYAKKTLSFFIAVQIMILMGFNEEITYNKKPSFKEFYSESLFQEIKDHIDLPQEEYRVASIGLHPAIAQFNGFYTLDSYNNFYPLSYKHQFRQIIENELAKNKNIRIYFDEWGGRCYLFTDELGKHYMFKKGSKKELENLDLNMDAFKGLGGKYIFSAIPINNAKENGLVLDGVFTKKGSKWKIHLYRVM
ncbi:DUF6044 family protein [Peribacillus sp. NPDC101481]|uniref:DUF6044 family protein n=1 Tax=Peribacillus sp. NPDC101481 TaxID=3364403 RepID=UPI00381524F3